MRFLVIRFRQMGDTVVSTPLLDTLRLNFPDARIDIVLNERIAPLLRNHPSVDNIITFTNAERHNPLKYLPKVWSTVRRHPRYDAIIDMRSTANTLLFSMFSLRTKIRSGIRKSYTWTVLNSTIEPCGKDEPKTEYNLRLLKPLERLKTLTYCRSTSLYVTDGERASFRSYMQDCGIDFSRPVMLAEPTAKLEAKKWKKEYMIAVLRNIITEFPTMQIVLNYAPGREKDDAVEIAQTLSCPSSIFVNVEAKGIRALMSMTSNTDMYFGNEGGTRHIADALGKPTFSVCSPKASKKQWIPIGDNRHMAVAPSDLATAEQLAAMTYEQKYDLITPADVWRRLKPFIHTILSTPRIQQP